VAVMQYLVVELAIGADIEQAMQSGLIYAIE
jgi:hypothetical protein